MRGSAAAWPGADDVSSSGATLVPTTIAILSTPCSFLPSRNPTAAQCKDKKKPSSAPQVPLEMARRGLLSCLVVACLASVHGFATGPGLVLRDSRISLAPGANAHERRVQVARISMQEVSVSVSMSWMDRCRSRGGRFTRTRATAASILCASTLD